jgi:hypothetical protein
MLFLAAIAATLPAAMALWAEMTLLMAFRNATFHVSSLKRNLWKPT